MTSLRASSTGRKKTELFFILTLALISLAALPARDFRAGFYVSGESAEIPHVFSNALECAGRVVSDEERTIQASALDEEKEAYGLDAEKASSARGEKEWKGKEEKEDDSEWKTVPVPVTGLTEHQRKFLLDGSRSAMDDIMRTNDLDELWLIETGEREGLFEIVIKLGGEEKLVMLAQSQDDESIERAVLEMLLGEYRAEELRLVAVKGNVDAIITVNGEPVEKIGRYLVLPLEPVTLDISRELYIPQKLEIEKDGILELEYELESIKGESVFISSVPWTDDITYNGERMKGGFVPNPSLPFSISVKKDGFESLTVSSSESVKTIEASLFPSELRNADALPDARDRFYTDLLLTLGGFGLGVTATVLDGITDADLSGVQTFCYGISVFQLIRTMDSLFAYRNAMRMGL